MWAPMSSDGVWYSRVATLYGHGVGDIIVRARCRRLDSTVGTGMLPVAANVTSFITVTIVI